MDRLGGVWGIVALLIVLVFAVFILKMMFGADA